MLAFVLTIVIAQAQPPQRDARASAPGACTIAGVVVSDDAQARPLRRARVTLVGQALDGERLAITGDDGAFAFEGLAAGEYSLAAAKGGFATMTYGASRPGRAGLTLAVDAGGVERIVVRLPRGAVITGEVLDADGTPVPGIDVQVVERRSTLGNVHFMPAGWAPLATDDRGVYRVYGLPAGDYLVTARPALRDPVQLAARPDRSVTLAQVFYPSTLDPSRAVHVAVRAGEERSGIDIQLQYVPLASVSGVVATPPGYEPAEIAVAPAGESTYPTSSVRTTRANDAGRFWFSGLPAGQYRIAARSASPDGTLVAATDLLLDGDDVDNLSLSLQPPISIRGGFAFRGDGRPLTLGTSWNLRPLQAALTSATAAMPEIALEGSRFRFDGILPGPFRIGGEMAGLRRDLAGWWLTSISANGVELLDAPLGVSESVDNAIATLSDRVSQVTGIVMGPKGAANGAVVVAFTVDRRLWFAGSRRIAATYANRGGSYRLRNLPPGAYYLAATSGLEPFEWYDTAVLERLIANAITIEVTGPESQARDLVVR